MTNALVEISLSTLRARVLHFSIDNEEPIVKVNCMSHTFGKLKEGNCETSSFVN